MTYPVGGNNDPFEERGIEPADNGFFDALAALSAQDASVIPTTMEEFVTPGNGHAFNGDLDEALADYAQAIAMEGKSPVAHDNRGAALFNCGFYAEALRDYDTVIEMDLDYPSAHSSRASTHAKLGDFTGAIADYKAALCNQPGDSNACNELAWILSTCSDPQLRDGRLAVSIATKACELTDWQDCAGLDTLAAAYAEIGDFQKAAESQTNALRLAPEYGRAGYRSRLETFQRGERIRI